MDKKGLGYTLKTFPMSRIGTIDTGQIGLRKHHIKVLLELDVTEARRKIREKRSEGVSLLTWLIKCIAQTATEFKDLHGVRRGKRGLVVFDDVDVTVMVEKEVGGGKVPLPYIIRKTNEKSISDIRAEIRAAQKQPAVETPQSGPLMMLYYVMPAFIRRLFWNYVMRSPFLTKRMMGTVLVTSVASVARVSGWFIPVGIMPLEFAIGAIVRKPGVVGDLVEIRDFLYMTVLIDHDVIDGVPAAKAMSRLTSLIESGYGLD